MADPGITSVSFIWSLVFDPLYTFILIAARQVKTKLVMYGVRISLTIFDLRVRGLAQGSNSEQLAGYRPRNSKLSKVIRLLHTKDVGYIHDRRAIFNNYTRYQCTGLY